MPLRSFVIAIYYFHERYTQVNLYIQRLFTFIQVFLFNLSRLRNLERSGFSRVETEMRVFFLVFLAFGQMQAKKSQLVCTSATDIKDCIFKNEDRIMELTKKNDLVWDKAVQIMLIVESLQKNVSTAEQVARTILKVTSGDGGFSEIAGIKVEVSFLS